MKTGHQGISGMLLFLAIIVFLPAPILGQDRPLILSVKGGYDTARIYCAMAKARRGENITVGVIGGSITQGTAASSESTRWANLMASWWRTTFPQSNVILINSGIGGTGSDIGVHRIHDDLLIHNPDFIVVEFSVNDAESEFASETMEGLIRQVLFAPNHPGVMMLILKQENGLTALKSHKPVAEFYGVPVIDFAERIDSQVAKDSITLHSIYLDGLHPVDAGMKYIAQFITEELDAIYNNLPPDDKLPDISLPLSYLFSDVFSHTYRYNSNTLIPSINTGWQTSGSDWHAYQPGAEITFTVEGNAISLVYMRHNTTSLGRAEAWVDSGKHITLDAYWTQTWGPASVFSLISDSLKDGEHTLHIRILDEHSDSTTGHYFQIMNVLKAGHLTNEAPIAIAGNFMKSVVGTNVELDGSKSFDPDNDSIIAYHWMMVSSPGGSTAKISDSTSVNAHFNPDVGGNYKFGLVVNDSLSPSVMNIKSLYVKQANTLPVANAGTDTTVLINKYVTLNGKNSTDADADTLTYLWRMIAQPQGSTVDLFKNTSSAPVFKPLKEGDYKVGLKVNDGYAYSPEDTVTVTAKTTLQVVASSIDNISFEVFPNPAHKVLNIKYDMKERAMIDISIYSISGAMIATLKHEIQNSGPHELKSYLGRLAAKNGLAIVKLSIGEKIWSKKIVIN